MAGRLDVVLYVLAHATVEACRLWSGQMLAIDRHEEMRSSGQAARRS